MSSEDIQNICSQITNIPEFDPVWIGVNHEFDYYIMFELKPPWHRKVELGDNFDEEWRDSIVYVKESGIKIKFLAISPQGKSDDTIKVFVYKKNIEPFITLTPQVFDLPRSEVPKLIRDLSISDLDKYAQYKEHTKYRDIFVCIHSDRDQCCGKFGKDLYQNVKNEIGWSLSVRVWECSHLGGHRMAPTMLDMPSGNLWGFVSKEDVKSIVNSSGNHELVLKNFRGTMGSNKLSQIAEKELFYFWGWQWFNMNRKVGLINDNGEKKKVSIEFESYKVKNTAEITLLENGFIFFPANSCDDGKEIKKYFVESVDFIK